MKENSDVGEVFRDNQLEIGNRDVEEVFKGVHFEEIGNRDVEEVFKGVQFEEIGYRDVDEVFRDGHHGETGKETVMLMKCSRMFSWRRYETGVLKKCSGR